MSAERARERLTAWFARQMPNTEDVRIEGLERLSFGHSAETLVLALEWREAGVSRRRDIVLRLRPPPPGLLEPYDLRRQFRILRALEPTPVRSPRALWYEGTGAVLGREFYAMERLAGTVYERSLPEDLAAAPERLARMSRSLVESIAAIHRVDLRATGLHALGDGRPFLERELGHWAGEMRRVQRGPLPALERLLAELHRAQPAPSPVVTLVHGDTKPGNFAFEHDQVSGIFDWEMAGVGDPLADIGWTEINWTVPSSFTSRPGALTRDELVRLYEERTGIRVRQREWYRAFQGYKMAVILLVGAMLFDSGSSDDARLAAMGQVIHPITLRALAELGIPAGLEPGPVEPRAERLRERSEGGTGV